MDPQGQLMLKLVWKIINLIDRVILATARILIRGGKSIVRNLTNKDKLACAALKVRNAAWIQNPRQLATMPKDWHQDPHIRRCAAAVAAMVCITLPWTIDRSNDILFGSEIIAQTFTDQGLRDLKNSPMAYFALRLPALAAPILCTAAFVKVYRKKSATAIHIALAISFLPAIFLTSGLTQIGVGNIAKLFLYGGGVTMMSAIHAGLLADAIVSRMKILLQEAKETGEPQQKPDPTT